MKGHAPDHWQRIKRILDEAMALDGRAREDAVARACGDDPALRHEIDALLASHDQASAFLEEPAVARADDLRGRRLGAYRLTSRLGAGGMATVYLGHRADGAFQHAVAVKVLARDLDDELTRRRFLTERQILAGLDHPNIARLLDGGTTDEGRLYVVMEFVDGQPLDRFCRERGLSVRERLELFRTICEAVHFAHQRLVVHRDLKPANILVTTGGVPKLLDFGIAKLMDPPEGSVFDHTVTGHRAMTPAYASPEQVRGESIGTTSDVYTLGVILFELLCGRSPYRLTTGTAGDLTAAICDREVEKPSAAAAEPAHGSSLAGDLDAIVLKALRKEPHARYPSANELAEDLRRHLGGLPVTAAAGTWRYLAAKFVRRHHAAVAASVLAVLALIGGIAGSTWQAEQARQQRLRADRRFNDVRALAHAVLFPLHDAIRDLPGATPARKMLVEQALAYVDDLARESTGDAALQAELADAYERIGELQGDLYAANLGNSGLALASYRKALAIREQLAASHPFDDHLRRGLARAALNLSGVVAARGDTAAGLGYARRAQALTAADERSDDLSARVGAATAWQKVGAMTNVAGDHAATIDAEEHAVALVESVLSRDPGNAAARGVLGAALFERGNAFLLTGQFTRAAETFRRSMTLHEEMLSADPRSTVLRRALAIDYSSMGLVLQDLRDAAGALEFRRRAVAANEALATADPNNTQARRDLAVSYANLSRALSRAGEHRAALELSGKAVGIFDELAHDPKDIRAQHFAAQGHIFRAVLLLETPTPAAAAALAEYRRAHSIYEAAIAVEPSNRAMTGQFASTFWGIGRALQQMGDLRGALTQFKEGLERLPPVPLGTHDVTVERLMVLFHRDSARTLAAMAKQEGGAHSASGRCREAQEAGKRALAAWQDLADRHALDSDIDTTGAEMRRLVELCGPAPGSLEHP